MITDPDLARRAVEALERIADGLDKLLVTSRTDVDTPAVVTGEWFAAPKRGRRVKTTYLAFHAVHEVAGELVTACGASGCGGEIETESARALEDVPRFTPEATRCDATGCRQVYAEHPPRTESS